jgi:hypothetical protein
MTLVCATAAAERPTPDAVSEVHEDDIAPRRWHCLYDEVFGADGNAEACRRSIETTFTAIHDYALRHYGSDYSRRDMFHCRLIVEKGNLALKLAYVLLILTHEKSLRDVVAGQAAVAAAESGVVEDREHARKLMMYYRVLAIATRSLFETAFDETNARDFVSLFIQLCAVAWLCMDSAAMSMFCDQFSSRCKYDDPSLNDIRCDDGGLFDRSEIEGKLWTAEEIIRDRQGLGAENSVREQGQSDLCRTTASSDRLTSARPLALLLLPEKDSFVELVRAAGQIRYERRPLVVRPDVSAEEEEDRETATSACVATEDKTRKRRRMIAEMSGRYRQQENPERDDLPRPAKKAKWLLSSAAASAASGCGQEKAEDK